MYQFCTHYWQIYIATLLFIVLWFLWYFYIKYMMEEIKIPFLFWFNNSIYMYAQNRLNRLNIYVLYIYAWLDLTLWKMMDSWLVNCQIWDWIRWQTEIIKWWRTLHNLSSFRNVKNMWIPRIKIFDIYYQMWITNDINVMKNDIQDSVYDLQKYVMEYVDLYFQF